ncbi:MAG: hypothetical protein CO013_08540 [Syntrophobacterales bacterium CG_4_8_14_3_um_filter_58_8]|nr:MAG: hypothetical protein AUK26_14100 [Syntrophaceae bacterium CG2_30_58_14]PJC72688.1 MAG: hypothetical protein CO013_08540 [Syntrophobacterales bacterium CG_4_8_14_3_um_filter_58_8]
MTTMRTIITISEQEKRWLAAYSGLHGVSPAAGRGPVRRVSQRSPSAGSGQAKSANLSVHYGKKMPNALYGFPLLNG